MMLKDFKTIWAQRFLIVTAFAFVLAIAPVSAQVPIPVEPQANPTPSTKRVDAERSVVGIQITSVADSEKHVEFASGVVVIKRGFVLTHLAAVDGNKKLQVVYSSGRRVDARITMRDKVNRLAILYARPEPGIERIEFANSKQLRDSDVVLAIGRRGNGVLSQSSGSIVSLAHTIRLGNEPAWSGLIRTSAASAAGQSGGPLLDRDGKMVGLILPSDGRNEQQTCALPVIRTLTALRPLANEIGAWGALEAIDDDSKTFDMGLPYNQNFYRFSITGPTTTGGHAQAVDPPSNKDILAALRKVRPDLKLPNHQGEIESLLIIKEKIADYVDQKLDYPQIGRAQLHHAHYRCTLHFDGLPAEVVFVDHNHLHQVAKKP